MSQQIIKSLGPGLYQVLKDGRSYEVRIVPGTTGFEVLVNGQLLHTEPGDPRSFTRNSQGGHRGGHQDVKALMPGKVVRILVTEGDTVQAGQGLLVVEAMKMQNELKAVREGRICQVHVNAGETVAAGATLVTIE